MFSWFGLGGDKGLNNSMFINQNQFNHLKKGDIIDHRNREGRFLAAKVIAKSNNSVKLHYIGFNNNNMFTVNYYNNKSDFAAPQSVSNRKASGKLSKLKINDIVTFRPMIQGDYKWRNGMIIEMDEFKDGGIKSGQVKIRYKSSSGQVEQRWTHLDNNNEIRAFSSNSQQQQQQQQQTNNRGGRKSRNKHGSNNNHHQHGHNGCYNNHNLSHQRNDNGNQHQMQEQKQMKRQDQMTVRTQLLLDDTSNQVKLTKEYLNACNNNNLYTKDQIKRYNQKVVVGLQMFQMKVESMRDNQEKENINFGDAFKASAMIIRQFENEYKSEFGNNKYLMQRLNPCLNYMRAVLQGKDVPALPYINNYKFDKNVASEVIGAFNYAQNHTVPDRMNDINNNNKYYKNKQKQLTQQYNQGKYNDNVQDVNYNQFIQDYNTNNIAFGKSKAEQDRIMNQKDNIYRYQQPDIFNGTGNDNDNNSDFDMM